MIKTLIAIAVAGAFALPLAVQASGTDNMLVAQAGGGGGGDTGSSTRQPGATPPGWGAAGRRSARPWGAPTSRS